MADKTISQIYTDNPITVFDGTEKAMFTKGGVDAAALFSAMKTGYFGGDVKASPIISFTSAEILALFTTPKQLVAAPGANKVALPLFISTSLVYNSAPYATNIQMLVKVGSSTLYTNSLILPNNNDYFARGVALAVAASGGAFDFINAPILATVSTGNPTAGNSTIKMRVIYEVVDIF